MPRGRPSKGNSPPRGRREELAVRDGLRCRRCASPASEVHHRRSRRVRDEHCHGFCNTISLCGPGGCHAWAHAHPEEARKLGLIVGRDVADPSTVPVFTFEGWVFFECDGMVRLA